MDGEATCVCDAGYEGNQCDEMVKTKFLGTYDVTETCDGSSSAARTLTISSGSGNSDLIFDNLIIGEQQDAIVDSTGTNFDIPSQTLFNGTINGNGSINVTTGEVSFTYYQNYPGYPEIVCSGTLSPQ